MGYCQVSSACKSPSLTIVDCLSYLLRGAMCTFATEGIFYSISIRPVVSRYHYPATGFSEAFPGIKPHLLTLSSNFQIPIYRDILLALGICSVSRKSCSNILKAGPGSAITIVVGGAAESLSAHPGTADLTLRRRYICSDSV
jgi:hypothetical protein